ncbi:bifunctional DNA primase/polymerase [Kitasatospora acidiphila]|uniref:bifunctional DNA primase/polymerase n=1 Tax=Kitasatospora acidiphila TaxID=2567942 RepID=UPI001E48F6D5|nr:bifunctional DNA primase/polymerase [Kitasatospora acidiphila]
MDEHPGIPEHGRGGAATSPPAASPLLTEAVRYAEDWLWEVVPGTHLVDGEGGPYCSCRAAHCSRPGAHPAHHDWQRLASAGPTRVGLWWTEDPQAAILLPAGRSFDVLDVSMTAGCLALTRMERMETQFGPVLSAPAEPGRRDRRMLFLAPPGTLAKLPELLRRFGWAPDRLDLTGRGEGDWIVAPPSRLGPYGFAQWARPPSFANRWLPDAAELVGSLAYACRRAAPWPGH